MPFQFSNVDSTSDKDLIKSFLTQMHSFLYGLLNHRARYFRGSYNPYKRISRATLSNLQSLFTETDPDFHKLISDTRQVQDDDLKKVGLSGKSLRMKLNVLQTYSERFLREGSRWLIRKIFGYLNAILGSFGAAISASMGMPNPADSVKELKEFIEHTFL